MIEQLQKLRWAMTGMLFIADGEEPPMYYYRGCDAERVIAELEAKIEDIKDVYIDEHKRWAINCGDSSCCACMDLLSVLDAINDVLEIHGKPLCYEGVPVKFGFHT